MIDIQMLIIMYMIFIDCYDICCSCTMLQCILQGFCTIFGHQMMKMASKMGVIHIYQFGARSGHMAIGFVLVKCLSYDMG